MGLVGKEWKRPTGRSAPAKVITTGRKVDIAGKGTGSECESGRQRIEKAVPKVTESRLIRKHQTLQAKLHKIRGS